MQRRLSPKAALLVTLLAALSGMPMASRAVAQAAAEPYSATYTKCVDAAGGVIGKTIECSAAEYARLDARLNAAYGKVLATLSPDQKTLLRNAQRAWLAHRDSTCSFMTRLGDRGTMARLSDEECLLDETGRRARWLEIIVEN